MSKKLKPKKVEVLSRVTSQGKRIWTSGTKLVKEMDLAEGITIRVQRGVLHVVSTHLYLFGPGVWRRKK